MSEAAVPHATKELAIVVLNLEPNMLRRALPALVPDLVHPLAERGRLDVALCRGPAGVDLGGGRGGDNSADSTPGRLNRDTGGGGGGGPKVWSAKWLQSGY